VRGVRRSVVLALATAVATASLLATGIQPAFAHICPIAAEIPVAQPGTIDVGVTVENATVTDVEITLPPGLQLDRVDPKSGWTFTRSGPRSGSTVRYRGGSIAPFACEYFSLGVTAPTAGAFGVTVIQRNASEVVVARSVPDPAVAQDRVLDQFVYAGVKPPAPPSTSSGPSAVVIAGGVLVGLGVAMAVVVAIRSRRGDEDFDDDGSDADDEDHGHEDHDHEAKDGTRLEPDLQARLDRFKQRTSDPRPPE
jgi:uncharacterized protein YcnI